MKPGPRAVIAKRFLISGRVQGVGYRFFAEREANALGIRGYVRNLLDGRVEAYAVGDERMLEEFRRKLKQGPRSAEVSHVREAEEAVNDSYSRFVIEG
ncbi:MAG: acylphosphatase [Terriglobia bacterium]